MNVKNVVILGSTGTIGMNTLAVIARYPRSFKVVGLTAYHNFRLLERQVRQFSPSYVAVCRKGMAHLKGKWPSGRIKILNAETDLSELVSLPQVDLVVIGICGSAALAPFLAAVRCGKTVAPANKEALVMAGEIIMAEAQKNKARIIPVDSEQSAIFQCLEGRDRRELQRVYLTASGGTLYRVPRFRFDRLTVREILRHPRWKMGKKITVDSATMMNKGFEVIEAIRLFNLRSDQIQVVIHPEAVIHSMVSFKDGTVMAQLGITDMRLPIQYALTYPQRWDTGLQEMNFFELGKLTFDRPDLNKFPALGLALTVAQKGGTLPSVLNAADEEAVAAFLQKRIRFSGIYALVEKVVRRHRVRPNPGLEDILTADRWARDEAQRLLADGGQG